MRHKVTQNSKIMISGRSPVITFQSILADRQGDELLIDSNGTGATFETNISLLHCKYKG